MLELQHLQLLQSCYRQVVEKRSSTVIFTSAGTDAVDSVTGPFLKDLPAGTVVLHCSGPRLQSPYYPLLDWIREEGNRQRLNWEKFFEKAGVYPLHIPAFLAEMQGLHPNRAEEMIPEELGYERKRMYLGVARCFSTLFAGRPVVLVLRDVNHYAIGTMNALLSLIHDIRMPSLVTIMTLDERRIVESEYAINTWEKFRETLADYVLTLNLDASDGVMSWKKEERRPSPKTIERLDTFLCHEDCVRLDEDFSLRPEEVDSIEEEEMSLALGNVYYMLGDYPTAVLLFRNLLKWERGRGQVSSIILIYRRLGYLSFLRNNLPEAKKWASQALKLAQTSGQDEELFYAIFLLMILDSREPFVSFDDWQTFLEQLKHLGESRKKPNNLAYRLSKPDRYNPVDHAELIDRNISQAIKISTRIGNELRLANAYHILGYNRLFCGRFAEVMPLYKKSEALRKRIGNTLELSYLYNGTGYFLHQQGEFKKAFPYLQKSVEYALMAGDYHEICMGLCNIAINDLYSFQYSQAAFYLGKVIQIMNIIAIKNLSFHSFREVLLLYGVAMLFSGRPDRAFEKYSVIVSMELPQTDRSKTSTEQDEILIENLFNALVLNHEGRHGDAIEKIRESLEELKAHEDIIAYRIPFVSHVLGELLFKAERKEEAEAVWRDGLKTATEKGYPFYAAALEQKLKGAVKISAVTARHRTLDFDRILESAKFSMDLQRLHKVVERIDILNTFRQILDTEESEEILISRALNLINTSFPSDVLVFSYYRQGAWYSQQENMSQSVSWSLERDFPGFQDTLWRLHNQLAQVSKPFSKALHFLPFQTYVHVPVGVGQKKEAHLFLATQQSSAYGDPEDLKILELAAFQLSSVLEKRWKDKQLGQATEALKKLAVTDPLTGLYNRNALLTRLAEERERAQRYGKARGAGFSIVFIDLDNFKYYNDTFGHKVGDLFLVAFADLLRQHLRNVDFSCRYGGDEFVLILPETEGESAMRVAQRILDSVRAFEPFRKILLQADAKPDIIPPEKKLGCSMGVAEFGKDNDTEGQHLLQIADRALYQAKNEGKNQARLYQFGS